MAKIRTTIHFDVSRLGKMKDLSRKYGFTLEELIKWCVMRYAKKIHEMDFGEHALKYQKRDSGWKGEHFSMTDSEYDLYKDLMKHSRCCFSLLVALALEEFAELYLELEGVDSYPIIHYSKNIIFQNNYPIYIFSWGKISEKIEIDFNQRE
jgi:hypothetical protein